MWALLYPISFDISSDVISHVFIYFKDYSDTKQSLTYPSEKLVVTVSTSVTTGDYDGIVVVVVIYLTSLSVTQSIQCWMKGH